MSEALGKTGEVVSHLEKATEPSNFLLMAIFTLLADAALVRLHSVGLIGFVENAEKIKPSFALEIFLLFVAYAFLMSMVMPMVSFFMNNVVISFVWTPWTKVDAFLDDLFKLKKEFRTEVAPNGYIHFSVLSEKAHFLQTSYLLDLMRTEKLARKFEREQAAKSHFYAVCALVAFVINFCFTNEKSLLNKVGAYLESDWWIFGLMLWIAIYAFGHVFMGYKPHWVYCPSIAKETEDAKREAFRQSLHKTSYK